MKKALALALSLLMIISFAPFEIIADAGTPVMTAENFVSKAIDIAQNYKTLYVMGCFGSPLNTANKARYTSNHSYNEQEERKNMINNASSDTFGFDCVCLIKGILWGWNGDLSKTYGGAKYKSNGVPDIGADAMINVCSNISTDFSNISVGEAVWMSGHIGIYIGNGLAVECTPRWDNGVQITACNRSISGYNRRDWTKHGKLPYIAYDGQSVLEPTVSDNPDDYPEPTKTYNYWNGAMTGEEVKWIQAVLNKLGYAVDIDGSFGPATAAQVKKFQSDNGLEVDGSAGPATRAKLKECWKNIKSETTNIDFSAESIELELSANRTQSVTGKISGEFAHWQNDWDENAVEITRTEQGGNFLWRITANSVGVSKMVLKAQDEKYNTIAEKELTIIVKCNHLGDITVKNQKASTCISEGNTGDTYCATCGEQIAKGLTVLKSGHNYAETVIPATEDASGYTEYICKVCGYSYKDSYTDYIPKEKAKVVIGNKIAMIHNPATEFIIVAISVENTPEIKTFALSNLNYDKTVLELVSFDWDTDGILKNWNGTQAVLTKSADADINGKIITLTFKVKENCADYAGDYSISCSLKARKADGTTVEFVTVPGVITLKNVLTGDLDSSGNVDENDALYLLYHTFFPNEYPLNQDCDFDDNGKTDEDDAMYILYYTFFPNEYPLNK